MSKFLIDCDSLPAGRRRILSQALSEVCTSDMPLVLELVFVSAEEIKTLNREKRGVDSVTDVLSFPAMNLQAGAPLFSREHTDCIETGKFLHGSRLYLGSVAICRARAEEQAAEYGHSLEREIFYLAVHGALHCLGYDHEREDDRAEMREKEEYVMKKMHLGRGE